MSLSDDYDGWCFADLNSLLDGIAGLDTLDNAANDRLITSPKMRVRTGTQRLRKLLGA